MVTPIRDVLTAAAGRWGLRRLSWLVDVQRQWPTIVGPVLAGVSRPEHVRGDALVVVATQPVAAQEIRLRQRTILRALPGVGRASCPTRLLVIVRAHLPRSAPVRVAQRAAGRQAGRAAGARSGVRAKRR